MHEQPREVVHCERVLASGLRVRVAGEVREGSAVDGGVPFAVGSTPDRGVAIALCDGTMGWDDGRRGSRIAAATMAEAMADAREPGAARLRAAMARGGATMVARLPTEANEARPSCMAAMVHFHGDAAHVARIGDASVVLVRGGVAEARTRVHRLVDRMITEGALTPAQAQHDARRHVIWPVLGGDAAEWTAEVMAPFALQRGDTIVLAYRREAPSVAAWPALLAGASAEAAVTALLDAAQREAPHMEVAAVVATIE